MVRRWSHINYLNSFFLTNSFNFFKVKKKNKIYNIKFSLSLKRFNKKFTKFRRKSLKKIKHLTNWILYHNIFKFWSKDFLLKKKTSSYIFTFNIFFKNYFFFNLFLYKKNFNFLNNCNFIFSNLSSKSNSLLINLSTIFFFKNFFLFNIIDKNYYFFKTSFYFNKKIFFQESSLSNKYLFTFFTSEYENVNYTSLLKTNHYANISNLNSFINITFINTTKINLYFYKLIIFILLYVK